MRSPSRYRRRIDVDPDDSLMVLQRAIQVRRMRLTSCLVAFFLFFVLGFARSAVACEHPPRSATLDLESAGRPQRVELVPFEVANGPVRACETPCTLALPPGRYGLLARGKGVRAFEGTLDVPASATKVRLLAPSKGAFVAGVVLTSFGGAGTLLMGGLVAAILMTDPPDAYNQSAAAMLGVMTAAIPIPCLVIGLRLLIPSLNRGYEASAIPGSPATSPGPPGAISF